ncbi:MAG: HAMP domain-containing histidine kinase [Anaerolineae bacterium]|nr:HAMP domain-containing histidine kinase [Anaerolineae bacterium]
MPTAGAEPSNSLQTAFHQIVRDIVDILDYTGAMIATYEPDQSLPVRAFYVNPTIASTAQIREWEATVSKLMQRQVSIIEPDPSFARVYVTANEHQTNLSVKAFLSREPVVADDLYTLFGPVLPSSVEPIVNRLIQPFVGVKQIVAVPFFIDMPGQEPEIVGNLFAGKRDKISELDIRILSAFGRQAAAAIELERHRQRVLQVAHQLTIQMQARIIREDDVLQQIVEGVVNGLGYVGAMVSTFENDGSLSLRATYISPQIVTEAQIRTWEERISHLIGRSVSILEPDPSFARVFIAEAKYQNNLSVESVRRGRAVTSDELFTLFTPVLPMIARPVINHIVQPALGIRQLVAVPFYLEGNDGQWEILGNLFAATEKAGGFSSEEIELLQAFGRQAAATLNNARLYRRAKEQQEVATVFGKMAFSASAAVHELRNRIGSVRMHLYMMQQYPNLTPEQQKELLNLNKELLVQLQDTLHLLDRLHEPWQPADQAPTYILPCLQEALYKVSTHVAAYQIELQEEYSDDLPPISTVPVMLTEAFKIVLDNSIDAIIERKQPGKLQLRVYPDGLFIHIIIQDNGTGIRPENLANIFAMKWSTKTRGMGFGLFWARDYLEGLGGRIEIQSQWGSGTTVHILLPVANT